MEVSIKNGDGGCVAKVDSQNRLHTQAFTVSSLLESGLEGKAYNLTTGIFEITNDTENAMLYIKNDEDDDIIIQGVFIDIGLSTDGSGSGIFTYILNPTTGTLISDANAVSPVNRRIGDSKLLASTTYVASALSKTITDGTEIEVPIGQSLNYFAEPLFVIPKGAALAVTYTGPTGNTTIDVEIGFLIIKNGFLD